MKIGIYCTNNLIYPTPDDAIYASMDVAGTVADELAEMGEDVTFFAPIGTQTKAKLVTFGMLPFSDSKIHTTYPHPNASYHWENLMLMQAFSYMQENNFDIFHSHARPFSIIDQAPIQQMIPTVVTIHDPLTDSSYSILKEYNRFKILNFCSLSYAQRRPRPEVQWAGNVYNGTDINLWNYNDKPQDYLLSVGRIMPDKGTDIAVQIALKSKRKLKIIGSYYPGDETYFNNTIKPYLGEEIEYLGQLPHAQTADYFRNAYAFLMPVRWEEAFGLVVIEAMASGTPVIATHHGSLPELIIQGKTGYIAESDSPSELAKLVDRVADISRYDCRKHVENNYSNKAMAENYRNLYTSILTS